MSVWCRWECGSPRFCPLTPLARQWAGTFDFRRDTSTPPSGPGMFVNSSRDAGCHCATMSLLNEGRDLTENPREKNTHPVGTPGLLSNDAFFLGGVERGINGRETPKTFPACVKGCVLCIFQKGRLVKRGIACRFQGKLTHGSSVGWPLSVLACRHSAWDDEQLQKEGRRIVHSSLRPHLRCDTLPSPLSTSPPQQKQKCSYIA